MNEEKVKRLREQVDIIISTVIRQQLSSDLAVNAILDQVMPIIAAVEQQREEAIEWAKGEEDRAEEWRTRYEQATVRAERAKLRAEETEAALEEAKEVLWAAYKKLTNWEQYGEHPNNPLPTRIRDVLSAEVDRKPSP